MNVFVFSCIENPQTFCAQEHFKTLSITPSLKCIHIPVSFLLTIFLHYNTKLLCVSDVPFLLLATITIQNE